jgi:hypothetical protein
MPFQSRAQWRWAFANKKSFAKKWAHQTTGTSKRGTKAGKKAYGKLPSKKRTSSRRTRSSRSGRRR